MTISQFAKEKRKFWWVMVFLLLAIFDLSAKHYAKKVYKNYDFAFSLPLPTWSMYFIYGVVMVLVIWHCVKNFKKFSFWQMLAWIFIMSGAILNIGERIALGYVRDIIYIFNGIFNLADFYIIIGIVILLLQQSFLKQGKNGDNNELGIRN